MALFDGAAFHDWLVAHWSIDVVNIEHQSPITNHTSTWLNWAPISTKLNVRIVWETRITISTSCSMCCVIIYLFITSVCFVCFFVDNYVNLLFHVLCLQTSCSMCSVFVCLFITSVCLVLSENNYFDLLFHALCLQTSCSMCRLHIV